MGLPLVTVMATATAGWLARGWALSRAELCLLPAARRLLLTVTLSVPPLQCETSLDDEPGLCWCVYPWSREKIPGSVEVRGDPNCSQYFSR